MASIRKKGTGYEIRITDGYDSTGKQITISRMFKPKETWSEKKALSEARKFADTVSFRFSPPITAPLGSSKMLSTTLSEK